jgi:hypothetical protein
LRRRVIHKSVVGSQNGDERCFIPDKESVNCSPQFRNFIRAPRAARGSPPRHAKRASGTPGLRRKERIISLLSRHLPFSSQARLGTVPGYYQPSRYAGLNLYAVNSVESRALQKPKGVVHVRYCSLKKRR